MKLILSILFSVQLLGIQAQIPEIVQTNTCLNTASGSLEVLLTHDLSEFPLPYTGDYLNDDTGDFQTFEVNSNPFYIEGLSAGDYELEIDLGQNYSLEFCASIEEVTIDINRLTFILMC